MLVTEPPSMRQFAPFTSLERGDNKSSNLVWLSPLLNIQHDEV